MIFLPSDNSPHYKLTITIIIPTKYDRRGRSPAKTNQIAQSVKFVTSAVATSHLWGTDALSINLVPVKTKLDVSEQFTVVDVQIAAPLHFNRVQLARKLKSEFTKKYNTYFSTYVQCERSYSEEELQQDYW